MAMSIKRIALAHIVILAILLIAVFVLAWSGAFNFAADEAHSRPVYSTIEYLRQRAIRSRAEDIKVPALGDQVSLIKGAGNYEAMCAQCHRAPGMQDTELSRGLYPAPPNLSAVRLDARDAFWSIKHGIKASGMPAWGKSMSDDDIWNLVALIQKLPDLKADAYRALVERSSGHSHAAMGAPQAAGMRHGEMEDRAGMKAVAPQDVPSVRAHEHQPGQEH